MALNAITPYFTMFPLGFPLGILKRSKDCNQPAGVVVDPFCGRGTTNFAARLLGKRSIGIDCNAVAVASTAAKLIHASPDAIVREARGILEASDARDVPTGEFWKLAYHPSVLIDLCKMRSAFQSECSTPERIALRAIMAGALHGPLRKNGSSYFSNQSPRTYAPKPRYAIKFWRERGLLPPKLDVISIIKERSERYYSSELPIFENSVAMADSRDMTVFSETIGDDKISTVITSPPYFGLDTYLADQWIRSWFLGAPPHVDYSRENQVSHRSWEQFAVDLRRVWKNVARHALPNARLIVRFGGINERNHVCPRTIMKESLRNGPWRLLTARPAGLATHGKQQSRSFLRSKKEPIPEYDFYCALA